LDLKVDASDTSDLWNDITPMARWEWCAGSMQRKTRPPANGASTSASRSSDQAAALLAQ